MKLPSFFSILPTIVLLFASPLLHGQCHGAGGSHSEHSSASAKQNYAAENSSEVIYYACLVHTEVTSLKLKTCSKCGMNLELKKANIYKSQEQKDSIYFTCSMHPEVKETKPGNCPKCGMALIKKSVDKTSSKKNANKFSFKVYGNCGMCEETIEEAALSVSGVKSANWNKKTKIIDVVTADNKIGAIEVSNAIAASGYDTEFKKANDEVYNKLHKCCKYERREN